MWIMSVPFNSRVQVLGNMFDPELPEELYTGLVIDKKQEGVNWRLSIVLSDTGTTVHTKALYYNTRITVL